jgi:HTH-type transcriptional regulator/antitoxin HigA
MKLIRSEAEYNKVMHEVYELMNKGEKNLTKKESDRVRELALAVQAYEQKLYPIEAPKTLTGMIELKMYEMKLNQLELAKKLKISQAKLSLILNGKQKPDLDFLKQVHKELKIDAEFILENA